MSRRFPRLPPERKKDRRPSRHVPQGRTCEDPRQHSLACDASLRINSCTHGSSIAGHIMPRLKSMAARTVAASFGTHDASHRVSCCMQWLQRSLACGASLHSQGHVPTGYRQLPGGLRQIPARSDLRQAIGPSSFSPLPPDERLGRSSPTGGRTGSHPHPDH